MRVLRCASVAGRPRLSNRKKCPPCSPVGNPGLHRDTRERGDLVFAAHSKAPDRGHADAGSGMWRDPRGMSGGDGCFRSRGKSGADTSGEGSREAAKGRSDPFAASRALHTGARISRGCRSRGWPVLISRLRSAVRRRTGPRRRPPRVSASGSAREDPSGRRGRAGPRAECRWRRAR